MVSSRRAGDCKVWLTNFHKAAREMHSRPGLAWVRTSRFPAIKFKTCLALSRSMRLLQRWEWIPRKPRTFWRNTCRRLSTNLRQPEKWTPTPTTSRGWLLCFRRCCKVFGARLPAVSPRSHDGFCPLLCSAGTLFFTDFQINFQLPVSSALNCSISRRMRWLFRSSGIYIKLRL